jgi:hypothetical protein
MILQVFKLINDRSNDLALNVTQILANLIEPLLLSKALKETSNINKNGFRHKEKKIIIWNGNSSQFTVAIDR